ncbi:hypothetical protein HK105_203067 [Polyrhizophydium stewartii]|uniref:Ankyrin repeat protein n=1 Tax=Polyrhizophydium stewartii TaxID=2732419 RepID=A0ABR4ND07_9FUNG
MIKRPRTIPTTLIAGDTPGLAHAQPAEAQTQPLSPGQAQAGASGLAEALKAAARSVAKRVASCPSLDASLLSDLAALVAKATALDAALAAGASAQHPRACASPGPAVAPLRASVRFRPSATNEWDRMPAEIQGLILDAAGPFTKFTAGVLRALDLAGLPYELREQIWQDAVECEWQGDLSVLPDVSDGTLSALPIRSRWMLKRVAAEAFADGTVTQRVAIRNFWGDIIEFDDPDELARAAASEGAVWLLRLLIAERKQVTPHSDLAAAAAVRGHLGTIIFLDGLMQRQPWGVKVMNGAAKYGHIGVVRWLAANRKDGCSATAMNEAAKNGHLEVLQFLHTQYPHFVLSKSSSVFSFATDLRVLQWAHSHALIKKPQALLDTLAFGSPVASVQWVCATFGLRVTREMFWKACEGGRLALARWLLDQPEVEIDAASAEVVTRWSNTDMVRMIVTRNPECLGVIVLSVAMYDQHKILAWLHSNYPGCVTQDTLECAVAQGCLNTVIFLLEKVADVEWDLESARMSVIGDQSEGNGENEADLPDDAIETRERIIGLLDTQIARRRGL